MHARDGDTPDVLVTVVIPAWGRYAGSTVANAAASASHRAARTLVVDNAHDTPITGNFDTLRLHRRVTIGQARNAALAVIDTDYVVFLDADDTLTPDALDRLVHLAHLARTHPDSDRPTLIAGKLTDTHTGAAYPWPRAWQRRLTAWPRLFAIVETVCASWPVQGSLLPTSAVRDSGAYATADDAAEDWVLGVSLAWRCRIVPSVTPTMCYTPAPEGRSHTATGLHHLLAQRRHIRERVRNDPAVHLPRLSRPLLAAAHLLGALITTATHPKTTAHRRRAHANI